MTAANRQNKYVTPILTATMTRHVPSLIVRIDPLVTCDKGQQKLSCFFVVVVVVFGRAIELVN